jgi:hypothetical protein
MSLADSSYPLLNAFWAMFEFCDHRWLGRASLDGDALAPAHPLRCGWPEGGYTSAVERRCGSPTSPV